MTGFDIVDRYDIAFALVMGVIMNATLVMGAPLWVFVLLMFVTCLVVFIRHFDEFMWGPED
jgi:hypothetical protein